MPLDAKSIDTNGLAGSARPAPPLTPVFLLGMALRPLPLAPLNHFLSRSVRQMAARHSDIFARLIDLDITLFRIEPLDLPFALMLDVNPDAPQLWAERGTPDAPVAATIKGPLAVLMALLEGHTDGDALFFSRTLVIEGDTEAVLTLRNAVDGSDVDLRADMASVFGPFAALANRAGGVGLRLLDRANADMAHVLNAALSPFERRQKQQEKTLDDMQKRLHQLERQSRRRRTA